ncbi:Cof-type HAD-IIB family hydrolase [Paenibacillus sp. F6_3S_P_1C]|uniref:Cof-type HAD-IIB family hydrolase n=1 Tax=Paenibacillus vandeheii TaxID=3035917 RepID=A0ABT8JG90_9BACL|nr:Cof-type HAD-IIB family hydrolase [Paenibacillus vandeheii]MDN4604120.1 Cof-type HAD-IIB family hydrolase [Paenibacillus vandeheii]
MIKIVFMDVDGTLLSEKDRSLSPSTEESIRKLVRRGIQVVLVTGRPYHLCGDFRKLGIDTIISANGALIKSGDEVIHKSVLSARMVREFSEFAKMNGNSISYFTESFEMNGLCTADVRVTNALRDTLGLIEYPLTISSLEQEVYCICLYADQTEAEKFHYKFPTLKFVRFHPYVSNVMEENEVSKSIAAGKVLDHLNISREEAMAFGDGENDIDLLEYVGLGIAMGNGGERVKQSADYVTLRASEDGITHALKKFEIIE